MIRTALRQNALSEHRAPTAAEWGQFLTSLDTLATSKNESSYQNLFEMSPVPTLEQDYTALVEWMDQLRCHGVTDVKDWIDDDADKVRQLVPLISNVNANRAAVEVIGMSPSEVVGPIDPVIVNEGSLESWIDQIELVWSGGRFSVLTFAAAKPSGEHFDARRTMSIPLGSDGLDYSGVLMTIEDISEQREEQRRMQETIEAKSRFLASVSHEIRTPLTAILGFSEVLADEPNLAASWEGIEILRSIAEQARDVSHLVEDLLVSARGEIGELAVLDEPVVVTDELNTVLLVAGSVADRVTIYPQAGALLIARGDSGRVRQILRNLVSNADRYGGDRIEVHVGRSGGTVNITVRDDGAGVPEDMRQAIFEPFTRVDNATTMPSAVGIGLTICRQLAELMGGGLTYDHKGGYSEFSLSLKGDQAVLETDFDHL